MIHFEDLCFSTLEKVNQINSDNTYIAKEVRPKDQVYCYLVDI